MSDQDNLRDRIADLLWRTEEQSWEDQAQAIIDELGLDFEPRSIYPTGEIVQRVVGKWEKQWTGTRSRTKSGVSSKPYRSRGTRTAEWRPHV